MQRYLNFRELRAKLGHRSRSAIYNDLAAQRLPQPIKLGAR
ncbi:helix-turn-helix transcriptional regulator [Sandarakinorhabdus limnophila]|jgi:predicted DNA-binding transcriptional regulator AlpA|nr:AlpA family phage regulatory protein [Sandarakinorhabdus limnophila]